MHWMAFFFIGLFIGANAGIVMAGILFLAKKGGKAPGKIVSADPHKSGVRRGVSVDLQIAGIDPIGTKS
jgi:hypothetical protein